MAWVMMMGSWRMVRWSHKVKLNDIICAHGLVYKVLKKHYRVNVG